MKSTFYNRCHFTNETPSQRFTSERTLYVIIWLSNYDQYNTHLLVVVSA